MNSQRADQCIEQVEAWHDTTPETRIVAVSVQAVVPALPLGSLGNLKGEISPNRRCSECLHFQPQHHGGTLD